MEKMITSPTPTPSPQNTTIPNEDRIYRLDNLLASDSPETKVKVQCTEDDAINLDELLRDRDNDADELADQSLSQHNLSTSPSPPLPSAPLCPISRRNTYDEDEGAVHWFKPPSAKPGDFLANSISRVPSKSILKKVSSYGKFDASASLETSKTLSLSKSSVSMDSAAISAIRKGKKKPSFLNMSTASASSDRSEISGVSSYGIGLDLDDLSTSVHSPRGQNTGFCRFDENDADRAAGSALNSLDLSRAGKKMNRSVSFTSVDVREYDRTIGDNPSCRSGPPLSLDWSYSKKFEQPKTLDQYEIERQDRANSLSQLHVTKYRRRNLLSFNWGHSEEEMKSARRETKKLQRQRSMTQMLLPLHMAHEALISVKGIVAKKSRKQDA